MKKTLFLLFALVIGICAWAAPLKNIPVQVTQPNGQVIHCFASGDEFYNYLHDANGFTIVKGENGFYCYAKYDGQGQVVASSYRVGSIDPASVGLRPNVTIPEAEYQRRRMEREQYIRPIQRPKNRELNHGIYNNLVVFIRFAGDTYHTTEFSEVDSMFNANNYESISLHNFYHRASYNQLDLRSYFYPEPDGQTILSYEDIHPKEYYMPYDPETNPIGYHDGETADREFSMLERAIYYIADQVPDTLDLDYNGDGLVDNVVFVIKGEPGEWSSLLWPHRWCIYDRYVPLHDLQVYDFNLQLEIGGYFNVSTLCHEMCHSLGAPDLYHYNGGIDPVGSWDLMCGTAEPPQHQGSYIKFKYGNWIQDIPEIQFYGTYELESVSWEGNRRNAYKIRLNNYQWLLLEYRNDRDLFDQNVPDGGLLIYRIDTRYDGNAGWNGNDYFDEVYLFRPGGTLDEGGELDRANFCFERSRTEFSMYTNPYLFLTNGQPFDWSERIYNISTRGNRMSFTYGPLNGDGEAPGPNNFIAHVNSIEQQVELTWDADENAESYKVYRDGQELATGLTETSFNHPYSEADKGYHTYSVVSVTGGIMNVLSAPSDQWVIIGNYETLRLSIASESPYGSKGGEMEVSFSNGMPTQYLTIYDGSTAEAEYYLPANATATFNWIPGFDPDSKGIHVTAKHLNANGEGFLFDLDQPTSGNLTTYTALDEGLGMIPPQNLTAVSNGPEIQLQWTVPAENTTFNIYRDGRFCHTVDGSYGYLDDKISRSGTHNYYVASTCGTYSSWNPDDIVYATAMNYYCEPPQNLQGNYYDDGHVELNWEAPTFVGHGMMAYDNNVFLDQIGSNNHRWGIRIEPTHLALFEGHPLTQVELFDCSEGTYTFTIYNGEQANNNSQLYVQQQEMGGTYEWVRVDLDEAVVYDPTLPLWVCVSTSGAHLPIPCCDYVGVGNSGLIKQGNQWKPVTEFGTYRSWMLRAYTSPIENQGLAYNVYWGPEEGGEEQMVLGYEALTANQTSYNTTENQRYHITALWNNRETEPSNTVYLGPSVVIGESVVDVDVEVYPNPVSHLLTIKTQGLRHISLTTLTGAKICEPVVNGEATMMDMESLPQGLYLLRLLIDDGVRTVKVVKQ